MTTHDTSLLLSEIEKIDPHFSLAVLLEIYKEQSNFSLTDILHAIDEKERIMANAPMVIELYDAIGPNFTVAYKANKSILRFRVLGLKTTVEQSIALKKVQDIYTKYDIKPDGRIYIYHDVLAFGLYDHDNIMEDLVLWDRLMNSSNLLDMHSIDKEYNSVRAN